MIAYVIRISESSALFQRGLEYVVDRTQLVFAEGNHGAGDVDSRRPDYGLVHFEGKTPYGLWRGTGSVGATAVQDHAAQCQRIRWS